MVEKQINHRHYGEVIYDASGLLVCHLCGKGGFKALGHHVRQVHLDVVQDMREYKEMFGLNVKRGILVEATRIRKAEKAWENETVLNLFNEKSVKARFSKGTKGRTRDQVSEQTRRMLVKRIQDGHAGFLEKGRLRPEYKKGAGK